MCRHLAWLGQPRSLAELILDPPHALLRQSYAPRRQRYGTVNADGWGVAWWSPQRVEPARWRAARPMWADASLLSVAPHVASGCVLAAVRSATVGMPSDETACAPFVVGGWALSHNGTLDRRVLPAEAWPQAESVCDSALLAAWLLPAPDELAERVVRLGTADPGARLTVLLADGQTILATTWGDTLSLLATGEGVVVASEPYDDDPRWRDVPDHCLVRVSPDGVSVTDLPIEQESPA